MRLSHETLAALVVLGGWFGLNFVGIPKVVDAEPLLSLAGVMLAVLAVVGAAGLARVRWVALVYLLSLLIWAALQIETHWATYFLFDASARKLDWYQNVFGANWRFLPAWPGRTTPDGYHTILATLIVFNLALTLRDCARARS